MVHIRAWKILNWNIRGINSDIKCNSVRDKISETNCEIVCLQETKREAFDLCYIKNLCPLAFDSFLHLPSQGASGGIIVVWKSSMFSRQMVFNNEYALIVELTSKLNNESWLLTIVYAPCTSTGKEPYIIGSGIFICHRK